MMRQEKYDRLVERLGSAENFDKRPREIWTEEEVEIYTQRETLKNYLEDIILFLNKTLQINTKICYTISG